MPAASRPGGVTQYFRSLRPHWTAEVDYFTIGSRSDHESAGAVALRLIRDTWNFARCLRAGRYRLVHLNPSIGSKAALRDGILLLVATAFRKQTIVFAHGWYDGFEEKLRGSRSFAWIANRADAFVVLGSAFVARLNRLGYRGRVFIHSVPVDDELLQDAAAFEPPPSRPEFTILFLARLLETKGVYEALETFRLLQSKYPSLRLVVAGDGPELEPMRRRSRELDLRNVTFTGHVAGKEKCAVFRAADVYFFPSHSEGLPISVLEAMTYGLPVVTSKVGGLADFFLDGRMGFIQETRDPEKFASLLENIIADRPLAASIRSFNRQYAADHFAGSRIAHGLERIYQAVLEGAD